jgi:multimeric flavodoxin WrbA
LLSGSARRDGNTEALLHLAGNALQENSHNNLQWNTFSGKCILPCRGCVEHCTASGRCDLKDDFEPLAAQWLQADAILLGSPVYTFAPPAPVLAFFERLRALQRANPGVYFSPVWPQAVGIIAQGGSEYGGAEVCAQHLLAACQSVGCIPVSGDMPGFSQGVIGQVPDGQPAPDRLRDGAARLADRAAELARILSAGRNFSPAPIKVLLVTVGATPGDSGGEQLQSAADMIRETLAALPYETELERFDFLDQLVIPCGACTDFCSSTAECQFIDGMQRFRSLWFSAGAAIWLVGSGAGSSAANFQAAIDRMNEVRFEAYLAGGKKPMRRHLAVAAGIISGHDPLDAGLTWQRIRHISLLYQNLILPASSGSPGVVCLPAPALTDKDEAQSIAALVEQSVRLALITQTGRLRLRDVLPEEYDPGIPP